MSNVERFYNDFVSYELGYLKHPNRRLRRVHQLLLPIIRDRMPSSALDVGCGIGITAAWLAKRIPKVVGVDISPRAVAVATQLHLKPTFAIAGLPDDSLPAGPFDLVTLIDVIEHFPKGQVDRAFAQLGSVINADTVVAVNLPSKLFALTDREGEQVIDESVGVDEVAAAAAAVGFEPLLVTRYGVESRNQYAFAAFAQTYDVRTRARVPLLDRIKDRYWLARSRINR